MLSFDFWNVTELHELPNDGCQVPRSDQTRVASQQTDGPWTKLVMQSYPARALDRRLQVDWVRDPRDDPRVLMSLRVDFEPMG